MDFGDEELRVITSFGNKTGFDVGEHDAVIDSVESGTNDRGTTITVSISDDEHVGKVFYNFSPSKDRVRMNHYNRQRVYTLVFQLNALQKTPYTKEELAKLFANDPKCIEKWAKVLLKFVGTPVVAIVNPSHNGGKYNQIDLVAGRSAVAKEQTSEDSTDDGLSDGFEEEVPFI